MKEIHDKVIEALASTLSIQDSHNIKPTDKLKEDLGLDSMSSLTFLMKLEEMLEGFYVDPDTLDHSSLATVASISLYVENQICSNHLQVA